MTKEYKRFRRQAAEQLNCTQAAIDRAVNEGTAGLLAANRAGNPLVEAYSDLPSYVAGLIWWLYSQNPTLNLLMNNAKSPFSQEVKQKNLIKNKKNEKKF